MHDQNTAARSGRYEETPCPDPRPISFYATDGAIPLNFMPVPLEYDPDGPSTDGDLSVDRALARVSGKVRRTLDFIAHRAAPAAILGRQSRASTSAARDI
ncbi:hypothetical protein BH23CHL1_BH23CHL1_13750 [soil metagenome]